MNSVNHFKSFIFYSFYYKQKIIFYKINYSILIIIIILFKIFFNFKIFLKFLIINNEEN